VKNLLFQRKFSVVAVNGKRRRFAVNSVLERGERRASESPSQNRGSCLRERDVENRKKKSEKLPLMRSEIVEADVAEARSQNLSCCQDEMPIIGNRHQRAIGFDSSRVCSFWGSVVERWPAAVQRKNRPRFPAVKNLAV